MTRAATALGIMLAMTSWPAPGHAQSLGTFRWQLQPYCNVVTVTITTQGGVFALDGVDDQCGAAKVAAVDGTAFLNPDGSVGLGFAVVPSPTGVAVMVDATIDVASLSGTWRDSAGNTGTFRFAPTGGTGGNPRPVGTSVAGVVIGNGLSYTATGGGGASIEVDRSEVGAMLGIADPRGFFNVGVGFGALRSVGATASSNVAVGSSALASLTTGSYNTALGYNAAITLRDGGGNVAVGGDALVGNISGNDNVAVGSSALRKIKVNDDNTAVGQNSLPALELGNRNIAIGQAAGFYLVAGSNNIYIGSSGVTLDDSTTRLGSSLQQRAFIGGIRGVQTGAANAVPVVIDSNGQLGTINSSRRFKEDIQDLGTPSDRVLDLRPVQFRYTTPFADGIRPLQFGLIAEEVAEVLPELVSRSQDGTIETVQYHVLPTLLLAQVQRLERERAALAAALADVQARLEALERPRH